MGNKNNAVLSLTRENLEQARKLSEQFHISKTTTPLNVTQLPRKPRHLQRDTWPNSLILSRVKHLLFLAAL